MRHQKLEDRRCSYLVSIEAEERHSVDWTALSAYLSELAVANCDVIVVDASSPRQFEANRAVLRWVARHVPPHADSGAIEPIREALEYASCDKVIIAAPSVRYSVADIEMICAALDLHEVVAPQEYVEPLPWWSAIEASHLLVHRGVSHAPEHPRTFGLRKSAVRRLVEPESSSMHPLDELVAHGADVWGSGDLLVRREPAPLADWFRARPHEAAHLFANPLRTMVLFLLLPVALLLGAFGGMPALVAFAGTVSLFAMAVAFRGRSGIGSLFPLYLCLTAPLAVLERSVSVYWALLLKLTGSVVEVSPVADVARAQKKVAAGR